MNYADDIFEDEEKEEENIYVEIRATVTHSSKNIENKIQTEKDYFPKTENLAGIGIKLRWWQVNLLN